MLTCQACLIATLDGDLLICLPCLFACLSVPTHGRDLDLHVLMIICLPARQPAAVLASQVWLQEFAWTEADKPVKLQARSVMVPDNPKLARQPIFCFETMMNLLYWSCFVYDLHDLQKVSHVPQAYPASHSKLKYLQQICFALHL